MDMIRTLMLLLALSLVPAAARAGAGHAGEISHGDVQFARTALSWDGSPDANLTGVTASGGDQLFGHGWWYRVQGQTFETPFPTPTASLYGGNESSIQWANVSGGAFDADEHAFVFDAGTAGSPADGGYVTLFITISNNSAVSTLQMSLFHYVDFDLFDDRWHPLVGRLSVAGLRVEPGADVQVGGRVVGMTIGSVSRGSITVHLVGDGTADAERVRTALERRGDRAVVIQGGPDDDGRIWAALEG
jgi:hypothetical protein